MMSHCHQSEGLWNEPMIVSILQVRKQVHKRIKNTQIMMSEMNKDTKLRFKGIIEETSG